MSGVVGVRPVVRAAGVVVPGFALLLAACGGGGGGGGDTFLPVADDGIDPPGTISDGGGTGGDPTSSPDFSVVDIATSADTDGPFGVSVTIANGGAGAAPVPAAWFMFSPESGFTNNYAFREVTLLPQTSGESPVLEPGETRVFVASSGLGLSQVDFRPARDGVYYARLWINPDLSARLLNPEETVVESHGAIESDYTNNLSPETSFDENPPPASEGYSPRACAPDVHEENDTLAEATPILADQRYDFNGCDDSFDATVIDLEAGRSYQLREPESEENNRGTAWSVTVVDPDGRYLVRRAAFGRVVTAQTDGPHHVIATRTSSLLGTTFSLEVVTR